MAPTTIEVALEDRVSMHPICRGLVLDLLGGNELRWPMNGDQELRVRVFVLGGLVEILDAIGWEVSDGTGHLPKTAAVLHALRYVAYDLRVGIPGPEDALVTDEERAEEAEAVSLFRRWAEKVGDGATQDDPRMQGAEAAKAGAGRGDA